MSGYVPLFGSLTTGTLHGRWPDIGLWPIILSLSNRHGVVDYSHEYIAGVTGLPLDEVVACMRRFCEPDSGSRSNVEGGARLVLLDAHRNWGWRIVNHAQYRERARKQAWDSDRTASGRDADRKRQKRDLPSRRVPTRPDISRQSPLSDSDSDSDSEKKPGCAGNSGLETPTRTLWTEGVQLVLSWRTPKGRRFTEKAARAWIGSLLKSGQWFERSNGHDYPIRDREAKLLELIQAAADKRDPKAYVAGAVKQITGLRLV